MNTERTKLRRSILFTLSFVMLIWFVKFLEFTLSFDFSGFGILPRTLEGSLGIITGPLVHGDIFHLLSNTFPILILGIGLFYFYDRIALSVIILIYCITGFWVWVAARDAYHIGASGIVYGLLTFLLLSGFFRKDSRTLAISFIVLFLYGTTLFTGIIPSVPTVSWESHLMGAIAGVFCAIYFKNSRISKYTSQLSTKLPETVTSESTYKYHFVQEEVDHDIGSNTTYTYVIDNGKSVEIKKD